MYGGGFGDLSGRKVSAYKTNTGEEYTGKIGSGKYTYNSLDEYLYAVYVHTECKFVTDKGQKKN